jgi:replicative DNA helicase
MSRKIKLIARQLNVPVIIAHQLNRELEKRDDKRPHLFDLRDSGSIEQDADVVLFLYRDSYYNKIPPNQADVTEIIIAKQRQGEANKIVKVRYDKITQQYQSLVSREENLL